MMAGAVGTAGVLVRFFPGLVVCALVASIALVPLASLADEGLTILLLVSPEGRDVGQSVEINVEAYMWGTPADLDTLEVTIGLAGSPLILTKVSTGKWQATHVIATDEGTFGFVTVSATGDLGGLSAFQYTSYSLPGSSGGGSGGWHVKSRIANLEQVGISPPLGSSVVVEGRSYLEGNLTDGGQLNATARFVAGSSTTTQALTSTKVSDGVYRFTVAVPADLTVGRLYQVTVQLGSGLSVESSTQTFAVNPVPVAAWITSSSNTSATVRVLAGSTTAIVGASVEVGGAVYSYFPIGIQTIANVTGTTDAKGQALVNVSWGAGAAALLNVTVSSGGKTSTLVLYTFGSLTGPGWMPQPNVPVGCSAALQTDSAEIKAGQTAQLKVRVTEDGVLLASRSLTRFVTRDGASATAQAGNVTTDAQGNFTVTYAVPQDWKLLESLKIMVLCPSGATADVSAEFGSTNLGGGTSDLQVTVGSSTVGGRLHITATYTGSSSLAGAEGGAMVVPGSGLGGLATAIGGNPPYGIFSRSGTTFSTDVQIPSFYPEGDYSVIVGIRSEAAVSKLSDEVNEGNITAVHINAAGGPTGTPGTGGGILPGFEAPWALAAAAVVGLGYARRRIDPR
jgi:hypothetical protein